MSNQFRAKWKEDSIREAEVDHFKKLKVAEKFLNLVVREATVWAEEKQAAIEAGMDPAIALFGHRACGVDAFGNPLPEAKGSASASSPSAGSGQAGQAGTDSPTASESEPDPGEPAKPKRKQPYRPRIYAPQMIALGTRAATMLLDLVPLILGHWKRLVNAGIDPRRLALENNESKMAALLFEEIGVQYRDLDAGDYDRVKAALDQIEAWIKKAKEEETKGRPFDGAQGRGGPETGPPGGGKGSGTFSPDSGEKEPDPSQSSALECGSESCESAAKPAHSEDKPTREAAPYSMNGSALDWTKQ